MSEHKKHVSAKSEAKGVVKENAQSFVRIKRKVIHRVKRKQEKVEELRPPETKSKLADKVKWVINALSFRKNAAKSERGEVISTDEKFEKGDRVIMPEEAMEFRLERKESVEAEREEMENEEGSGNVLVMPMQF
jgi:hypothetical protein